MARDGQADTRPSGPKGFSFDKPLVYSTRSAVCRGRWCRVPWRSAVRETLSTSGTMRTAYRALEAAMIVV
jgi:hypothetical protein